MARFLRRLGSSAVGVGLGLAFGALVPAHGAFAHAHAQEAPLRAKLDSLRPLLEDARAALDAREARDIEAARLAAAAAATVDTFMVGLVTVVTPVEQAGLAREIFQIVWAEHFAVLERSRALDETVVSFQWSDEPVPIHVGSEDGAVELGARARRPQVEAAVRGAIASIVSRDLRRSHPDLAAWVRGDPLRPSPLEDAYRSVAATQSRATRGCLAGDIAACEHALDLREELDVRERLDAWYTPDERRALVAGWSDAQRSRFVGPSWDRCVLARAYDVCDTLLTEFRSDSSPLPGSVRETLLAYAIERGGAGAWERLLGDPEAGVRAALVEASGMSITELLVGWQTRLVAHRPETFQDVMPAGALSLLWTLLFAAFAMRSTRWRFD